MLNAVNVIQMQETARRIRGKLVEISHHARTPHLASALSCVDILTAAYWGALSIDPQKSDDPARDRFILSKGHAATSLYATLAYRGFFPLEKLNSFNKPGSDLPEQLSPRCVPGVEAATGSLGHGLPLGVGMALAAQIQGQNCRVYVLLSDGECNEGSVWEAALFAPQHSLGNVVAIIDYNKWQATDRSDEVMALKPLKQKWEAFGWSSQEVDGHDLAALTHLLKNVPDGSGKPIAIIAHTTKGKGVSFMEDDNNWHYQIPSETQLQASLAELKLL